jgi:hypothetical protein
MFYKVRIDRPVSGQRVYIKALGYHDALRIQKNLGGKIIGGGKRKY